MLKSLKLKQQNKMIISVLRWNVLRHVLLWFNCVLKLWTQKPKC